MRSILHAVFGLAVAIVERPVPRRDERGLSQSTELAIIIAGVLIIAAGIVTAITYFVNSKLPM